MSDLRQAASFALTTLQGWSNHDHWLWPESALAQAKQNTAEAIPLLEAALAQPETEVPTDEEVDAWADQQGFIRGHGDHPCGFWIDDGDTGALVRAALARWGK